MEIINFKDAEKFDNKTAAVFEYNLNDKDINICYCKINGRYPIAGFAKNKKCKELAFVLSGEGLVNIENKTFKLQAKDVVLIDKNEKFFWEGNLELVLPCAPAWNVNQYETIEK